MMKIVSRHGNNKRSSTNPKFIFLDEADMFCKGEHEGIYIRYIEKSKYFSLFA
jgi:hypothetical protein